LSHGACATSPTEAPDDAGGDPFDVASEATRGDSGEGPDVPTGDAPDEADTGAPVDDAGPCSQPSGVPRKALPDLYADNASKPTQVWIENVYVTAISGGACVAGKACQIFVQDATYASLGLVTAHHAIRLLVASTEAAGFGNVAIDDKLDVLGYAWRYQLGGVNEVLVQVDATLPACTKNVGSGTIAPVMGVTLSDLTVTAYEQTLGPLLVQVANVQGTPNATMTKTFGLFPLPDAGPYDAGGEIVSMSPFFLQGSAFTGLTGGVKTQFAAITGVFGEFVPSADGGAPPKFLELYPRTSADVVTM
jgi:hypothetical protein